MPSMTLRPHARGRLALSFVAAAALMAGCASPPKQALAQSATIAGAAASVAGSYDTRSRELTVTVNGEPVMRGSFPPYTPTLNLNGNFKGAPVRAECYFASILNNSARGGLAGRIVANSVQSAQGKTADECKVFSGTTQAAVLNF